MLLAAGEGAVDALTELFNQKIANPCYDGPRPLGWERVSGVIIPRKANAYSVEMYREIILLSVVQKLFLKCLLMLPQSVSLFRSPYIQARGGSKLCRADHSIIEVQNLLNQAAKWDQDLTLLKSTCLEPSPG